MRRAAVLAAFALSTTAHAQSSSVARALYDEGLGLQQRGECGEALERYKQSLGLEWAEATVLRTAECRAALGELVEAATLLRELATPAAATALSAIEQRLPTVVVQVQPPDAPELDVSVDGRRLSRLEIAHAIELNPGEHVFVARAYDYDAQQKSVALVEKQHAEIVLDLRPGETRSSNPSAADPASVAVISGIMLAGAAIAATRPSFLLVLGVGGAFEMPAKGPDDDLGVGGAIELELGLRVGHYFLPRLSIDGGPLVRGSSLGYDAGLGFMTSPEHFGLFAELAAGGRHLFVQGGLPSSVGFEGIVGVGVHQKLGALQIVPKANLDVGTFSDGLTRVMATFGVMLYWEHAVGRKAATTADYFVPNNLSPASPRPGTM